MAAILQKTALIMVVLLAFTAAGFLLGKAKLVRRESLLSLANILLYLCQPMLSIRAFAIDPVPPSGGIFIDFAVVAGISAAAILLLFGLSKLIFLFMKGEEERRKRDILVFIGTFSNCTFIGLPFIDMFTDGDRLAMMDIIIFGVVFNILIWTVGAYLITQDKKQISVRRALLNPCTVGSLIGLLLFLVPQINIFNMEEVKELRQIVNNTGDMTAPLSMLVVGVRLSELTPRELFADPKIYLAAAVRLILSFGTTYLLVLPFRLAGLFADSPYVLLAPVIAMSMPPAASIVAFAEKFDGEKRFAAAAFSTATLLSALTLPFEMLLVTL